MDRLNQFNNILIIKPGAIGDLLQMTPVLRALKARFPRSAISLLVGSHATAALFEHNAAVHETLVFEKNGTHKPFSALLKLWRSLHKKQFDLVLNFQRSNLKTWFLASAAFPCRVLVYRKARTRNIHAVANYLETISPLGMDARDMNLDLPLNAEERAFAEKTILPLGNAGKPLIALNPGASHKVNRWPLDHFAALADLLADKLSARIMIIGGREDAPLAEELASKTNSRPLVVTGKVSLLQLGALLEQCDILVSGDTGPLHLATAVGTRVVALFGAADPERTGPIGSGHRVIRAEGMPCLPCGSRTCGNSTYLECMENISVVTVFEAILDMLKEGKKG